MEAELLSLSTWMKVEDAIARLKGLVFRAFKIPPDCLRCENIKLCVTDCDSQLTFYECPVCLRRYAHRVGDGLVDRWLMPITLPLYVFVFRSHRICAAEEIAAEFCQQKSPDYLRLMCREIVRELDHPTQQLRDMYRKKHSEDELRAFLRHFVAEVEREVSFRS